MEKTDGERLPGVEAYNSRPSRKQVWYLLCLQLASYLERGPLLWMMPLHLHVNQKSEYDEDMMKNVQELRDVGFMKTTNWDNTGQEKQNFSV